MKAFLLAAGKGTRLSPLTDSTPKCLMTIAGKPLIEIWINLLEKNGVKEVLINTHHLSEKVERFVERLHTSVKITTVYEKTLLGSGGTVLVNQPFVKDEKDFIIAYADTLTNMNLFDMAEHHRHIKKKGGILTMALFHAPDPSACGIAELDLEQKIVTFVEKPENPSGSLANGGIYVASNEIFSFFPKSVPDGSILDFGFHILPELAGRMYGYEILDYLKDIGTIDALEAARKEWPLIDNS
ncbi:MAG: nucleotidyltransferase family protein [Desulfobacterales bacterium]